MMAKPPSQWLPALPRRLVDGAVNFLYPERCVNCGRFGSSFCDPCEAALIAAPEVRRCPFCHAHWQGPHNCPRCFALQSLGGIRAAFDYEGAARHIVRGLKYRHTRSLTAVMARHIAPLLDRERPDYVFPVPLHRSRLRDRGFNQAELLFDLLELELPPGRLERIRKTRAQYGLSARERGQNIVGALRYEGDPLTGLRVAILDDVVTSGATANECATVLRDAGASSV
jgi:ComF family protein